MSSILLVEAKPETIAIQAVLEHMKFDNYQRPKTQDQTINHQNNALLEKHENMIPRKFSEMFVNRNVVSNISRVETERETIAIYTVLENMNFDDYLRPKAQDQLNNYQRKYFVFDNPAKILSPTCTKPQTHFNILRSPPTSLSIGYSMGFL